MSQFTYSSAEDTMSAAESTGDYDFEDPFLEADDAESVAPEASDNEVTVHDLKEDEQIILQQSMGRDPAGTRRSSRIRSAPDFYLPDYSFADQGHADDVKELLQAESDDPASEVSYDSPYVPPELEGGDNEEMYEEEYIEDGEYGPVDEYMEEEEEDEY